MTDTVTLSKAALKEHSETALYWLSCVHSEWETGNAPDYRSAREFFEGVAGVEMGEARHPQDREDKQ